MPAHSQCNTQVENIIWHIKDYLGTLIHDNGLECEKFLRAMNFDYNTSYESTIGTMAFPTAPRVPG